MTAKESTGQKVKAKTGVTKQGETRYTVIIAESLVEKYKAVAYWDRLKIKDVIGEALQDYVTRYEKKNGSIKPIPAK